MIIGQDIWALDSGSLPWRCKGFSHIATQNRHENWRKVQTPIDITFNMIDATSTCVWGVDLKYQVYLFIKECDLPIRFQDYEFQWERRSLVGGWKPVVREEDSPRRSLSQHWTSDSVWRVDRNIEGVPTDKDGWQYATSFSSVFSFNNTGTSWVRRKRLAKYFEYNKMGAWAEISSGIKFLDVAAGGSMLPGGEGWPICVWGVSKECKVYVRSNVSGINPEGDSWKEICQPDFQLAKLSVGPRGQLWGITTQGELITRTGVHIDNIYGRDWLEIQVSVNGVSDIYPAAITVSADSVWMLDSKGRVFFHKGAEVFEHNTLLLTDKDDTRSISKWLHMIMNPEDVIFFRSLSCGPENQVWGLDNNNLIYNRTDISLNQIHGQAWQLIEDPNLKDSNYTEEPIEEVDEEPSLAPTLPRNYNVPRQYSQQSMSMNSQYTVCVDPSSYQSFEEENDCSPIDSQDCTPDNDFCELDDSSKDSESDSLGCSTTHEHAVPTNRGVHYWKMVSAGGCMGVGVRRDEVNQKQAEISKVQVAVIKECRSTILDRLREQSLRMRAKQFDNYIELFDDSGFKLKSDASIEMNGEMRTTTAYLSKNIPHGHLRFRIYLPGAGALEQEDDQQRMGTRRMQRQYEPTVIINRTSTVEHVEQVPLLSLHGIKRTSPNVEVNALVLYTANKQYKIVFKQDTDCNNWFDRVNDYVRAVHEVPDLPPNQSVWTLAWDGTVYFSPPVPSCVTNHSRRTWLPIEGNFVQISAGPRSIVWGVAADNNLYCFTRGYGGGSHHMGENLESFSVQRQFRCVENQRYKLLGGFQPCSGRDRMPKWEDGLGNPIDSEKQFKLPLSSWRWTAADWSVRNTEQNDADGWQYARNFHSPFSAAYGRGARKRELVRQAQLNSTVPWKKIPINLVKISRVTLEQYCYKSAEESVVAWALCTNGGLLYRHGVTPNKPQGEEWVHVDIDHPLVDVSVDAFCNLWAVCSDGSAYFRMGISEQEPIGLKWMHLVKPDKDHLVNISAGKYGVWALGTTGLCYIRTKVSSIREYGLAWELVNSEPMFSISVSGSDQVFGIRLKDKAIVSRDNISVVGDKLSGDKWSLVVQDVWSHVCITATSQQHHWDQTDELTSMAVSRYRTQIWARLRENTLKEEYLEGYELYCPGIGQGDRVCVKTGDGTWTKNIIDHIGPDRIMKIRRSGIFTSSFDTVNDIDVIRDEPPNRTHISPGTRILAKLSYMSNKYSPCVIKSINDNLGTVTIEQKGSQHKINDIRLENVVLNSDIYFLDGKRKHSVTNDELGREIII